MSSLVDSEASEASELSEEEELGGQKISNKHRPKVPDSSDSEEEEVDLANEEEICRKEGEGWIVDEEEEEEDGAGSGGSEEDSDDAGDNERDNYRDEDDDALDEEDFQLIRENIGLDLKKALQSGIYGMNACSEPLVPTALRLLFRPRSVFIAAFNLRTALVCAVDALSVDSPDMVMIFRCANRTLQFISNLVGMFCLNAKLNYNGGCLSQPSTDPQLFLSSTGFWRSTIERPWSQVPQIATNYRWCGLILDCIVLEYTDSNRAVWCRFSVHFPDKPQKRAPHLAIRKLCDPQVREHFKWPRRTITISERGAISLPFWSAVLPDDGLHDSSTVVCVDREVCWNQKVHLTKETSAAGNIRKLFRQYSNQDLEGFPQMS
ncbi:hypothetical protein CSKR_114481 [Clonorchis sinensis]|uniref:Spt6 acidic N-terminal domain-containing protein n=1 Tax=Clonorchis sinensis TaxID=79923 RepID=A0A3R7EY72_CLOSI|nr:hypothetical protein CSKR_114481 [Clonorchis sinensis]